MSTARTRRSTFSPTRPRPGGVVVFDDYSVSPEGPEPGSCGAAVDGFLGTVAGHYQVVFCDWQLAVRKDADPDLPALG